MNTPTTGSLLAPIFLRVVIGLIFVWAGLGKLTTEMPVSGQAAATLANMGVFSLPEGGTHEVIEDVTPSGKPEPTDVLTPATGDPAVGPKSVPTKPAADKPAVAPAADKPAEKPAGSAPLMKLAGPADPERVYVAADFPESRNVMGLHGISLLVKNLATPAAPEADANGEVAKKPMQLLPAKMGSGRWPVYLAWTAAITELVGGIAIFVGLFTRISAFLLSGTMVAAAWMTQIGPAMASGTGKFGFLPITDWYARDAAGKAELTVLAWQLTILAGCAALVFLGGGFLSLDRLLFPPKGYVTEKQDDAK